MTTSLHDGQMASLSSLVEAALGLHFPQARWSDLERQVDSAAADFGFGNAAAFLPWLLSAHLTQEQIEILARHLTISETYFWRDPRVFEALRESILPDLIRERDGRGRRLRIWSAGCATGEEVYSIAMLLHELIPALEEWHITLLATDINPQGLRRAALGVYGEWAFRNAPRQLKDKYFQAGQDGQFELIPEIRKMVTFAYLNLAEDTYPSLMNDTQNMDLIFCRNVLIYFAPEPAQQARQRFFNALVEGGWLVVAASELSQQNYSQFTPVRFPGAFAYRREAEPPSAPKVIPGPAPAAQKLLPVAVPAQAPPPPPKLVLNKAGPAKAVPAAQSKSQAPDLAVVVRDLASQGKLNEALLACNEAIATTSRLDPGLHYLHALILQEQKRDDEAKAALKRALYLDPSHVLAHFALGSLARRQGQTRVAQKSFQNALALLAVFGPDDILPEAEGLTAGRLREIMRVTLQTDGLTK